jgi:fructose-1,6-bisphosphatase class II
VTITSRKPESVSTDENSFIDSDLSLDFLRVVEQAAIACAHTMGQGDRHKSDQVAVEAMRQEMDSVPINGTIVIGEGERDEAPMLYIGEKVGMGAKSGNGRHYPEVDIAVDPLEGTNLCATGATNAIAVMAASEKGGLLHAPDLYMEKLVVGPSCRDVVDLDAPVRFNLRAIAQALGRRVEDLVVIVLDRPRHDKLIAEIRATGARIRLIGDGDLSAGITAAVVGSGVHAVMGIGGAPEGVLTAAAMRCLGGEIYARLVVSTPEHEERCRAMGITDFKRIYRSKDLASGDNMVFAATGVTEGSLMKGVRFFGDGIRTTSLVMQTQPHRIRFIDSIHVGCLRRVHRLHAGDAVSRAVHPAAWRHRPGGSRLLDRDHAWRHAGDLGAVQPVVGASR